MDLANGLAAGDYIDGMPEVVNRNAAEKLVEEPAQSAEAAIVEGHGGMIAFGRPYISNPDLVKRFEMIGLSQTPTVQNFGYSHDAKVHTTFLNYRASE